MLSLLRRLSVFDKTAIAALVIYTLFELYSRNFWVAYLAAALTVLDVAAHAQQLMIEDLKEQLAQMTRRRDVYKDLLHLILNGERVQR